MNDLFSTVRQFRRGQEGPRFPAVAKASGKASNRSRRTESIGAAGAPPQPLDTLMTESTSKSRWVGDLGCCFSSGSTTPAAGSLSASFLHIPLLLRRVRSAYKVESVHM
jgi:hypothetical protein